MFQKERKGKPMGTASGKPGSTGRSLPVRVIQIKWMNCSQAKGKNREERGSKRKAPAKDTRHRQAELEDEMVQ